MLLLVLESEPLYERSSRRRLLGMLRGLEGIAIGSGLLWTCRGGPNSRPRMSRREIMTGHLRGRCLSLSLPRHAPNAQGSPACWRTWEEGYVLTGDD